MLNRSKCPVMEVKDEGLKWAERVVVEKFENGSCTVVSGSDAKHIRESFYNNTSLTIFSFSTWAHCREIKKPQYRRMNREELEDLIYCSGRPIWAKHEKWDRLRVITEYDPDFGRIMIGGQWCNIDECLYLNENREFVKFEVEVKDDEN